MLSTTSGTALTAAWIAPVVAMLIGSAPGLAVPAALPHELFVPSDRCIACHNGLTGPDGRDVSIGTHWSPSMMANSARDPYWQAAVRREVLEHPAAAAAIEDECSACHMPMSRYAAKTADQKGRIFAHLPFRGRGALDALAEDGVSCSMCHQIRGSNLGQPDSFTAGFEVDADAPPGMRPAYGPFDVGQGRRRVMSSASTLEPNKGEHITRSELCATCHTLYTHSRGPDGRVIAELPEQMPYLEWRHSAYRDRESCQSCHMPAVDAETPITSVLAQSRPGLSQHVFRGGNFFMLRMLDRYRDALSVDAASSALQNAATHTVEHLRTETASVRLRRASLRGNQLVAVVEVENRAGHKLPTAYPSRRAWLHLRVTDGRGQTVFESGAFNADGSITGNDNDRAASRFEPHHRVIDAPDQVQVYEAIMARRNGSVTTGLLSATQFIKDNRILPDGFDKGSAGEDIAVQGGAYEDPDFQGGRDRVTYRIDVGGHRGPFRVEADLWYQPIAFRWAMNLMPFEAEETQRFVRWYRAMSEQSAIDIAGDQAVVR